MKLSKLLLSLIILFSLGTVAKLTYAYQYPISELGNCQNQKECHHYCEVPENQPACWSYRVYKTAVLGETTTNEVLTQLGFTFPIAELGNCANWKECKNFCQNPANLSTCQTYSQNIRTIVNQNLLTKAQAELGCTTVEQCQAFCSQEQNKSLCESFRKKWKIKTQARQTILNQAQNTLGCQTLTECKTFCQQEENKTTCRNFAQKLGLKFRTTLKEKLGCVTNEDCRKLCAQNPDQCPGYPKLASPNLDKLQRRAPQWQNVLPLKPSNATPGANPPAKSTIDPLPTTEHIPETTGEDQSTTAQDSTQF